MSQHKSQKGLNPETITGRINIKLLEILDANPDGVRWVDLARAVREWDNSIHPKTLNGCIWKLTENFADSVYKPSSGLYRLRKYQ